MKNVNEYINSGILEMYVLGLTSPEENKEVEKLSILHPEIKEEIESISNALITYSETKAPKIDPTVKPLILATIDYMERIKNGEERTVPPVLNEYSKISDYDQWLERIDLELKEDLEDFTIKLIGYQPGAMTAIVWIKEATPYEIHDDEFEKFLILEGTCDIITDTHTLSLRPGDYYSLPLNLGHVVKVTSKIPCKVILQRIAA
jgi:mannose-6-phosphate isomerase-like protein (cupin superfamily)